MKRLTPLVRIGPLLVFLAALLVLPDLPRANRIVEENRRPGTTAWKSPELARLHEVNEADQQDAGGALANGWTPPPLNGYARASSVAAGEPVHLSISANAPSVDVEVYRMGWYRGAGGRLVTSARAVPVASHPIPEPEPETGLLTLEWPVAYTVQTQPDWVSGIYLVKLIGVDGTVGYCIFVVRDDDEPAPLLYQVALSTYQAYNNWGGKSLYDFNSRGGRAAKVSFDRPYQFSGQGLLLVADLPLVHFLESRGYAVGYATTVDIHSRPEVLVGRRGFLSSFHDEYWSTPMRNAVAEARARGTSLAFFDSNNVYWQVRFESSSDGRPARVMVCYKSLADPIAAETPSLTTVRFRDPPVNDPENALLGVMYEADFAWGLGYPWIVTGSDHWLYDGTELSDGDAIDGLVGYEYDRVMDNGQSPPDLTVLAASPIPLPDRADGLHNAAIHTAASGALTFAAGTNYWVWALGDSEHETLPADPRVQRMTVNLLNAMLAGGAPTRLTPADPRTVLVAVGPSTYRERVLADDPVAYWRMDEAGGLSIADERGVHAGWYLGQPLLAPDLGANTNRGRAVAFRAPDQYVSVPSAPVFSPQAGSGGQISVEAWVQPWRLPDDTAGTVVSKAAVDGYEYALRLLRDGVVEFILWSRDGATYQTVRTAESTVRASVWHHLVGVCVTGQVCRVFVDGEERAAVLDGWSASLPSAGTAPVTVARRGDGLHALQAVVDEVAIYGQALSAEQIREHHRLGR